MTMCYLNVVSGGKTCFGTLTTPQPSFLPCRAVIELLSVVFHSAPCEFLLAGVGGRDGGKIIGERERELCNGKDRGGGCYRVG